jgi:hypothetical protein
MPRIKVAAVQFAPPDHVLREGLHWNTDCVVYAEV